MERYGIDYENQELEKRSELLDRLANIDEESPELLAREGKIPTANVEVGAYQSDSGVLPLTVTNIENIQEDIQSVMVAVWSSEDQSDLQWIPLEGDEQNGYSVNIDMATFDFKTGLYNLHIYFVDSNGQQCILAETTAVIE